MLTFTAAASIVLGILLVSFSASSVSAAPDGKALYENRCGTCHGNDGKGKESVAKIKEIDVALMDLMAERNIKKSDKELAKVVREGKDKTMPAFPASRLSDDDLKAILEYVRTLQKK